LRALWVTRDALGRPALGFAPAVDRWLMERGIRRHHLSLTDERDVVAAFVVLEREEA
jgi:holo-[acyl-carrier protein] synthase